MDEVILVDMNDNPLGTMEKIRAHELGRLHRAFSVFLFDGDKLLIQRRALTKYHCGGLWANTCCSHPREGEEILTAAKRRLREELGIDGVTLREAGEFVYYYPFANGLTEFEYDHVITGNYSGDCAINHEEVDSVRRAALDELYEEIVREPEKFAAWFITALGIAVRSVKA